MQARNGKNIVVTGVSSGISQETASCLASQGYRVFGSVRTLTDRKTLDDELGDRFHALVFDIIGWNGLFRSLHMGRLVGLGAGIKVSRVDIRVLFGSCLVVLPTMAIFSQKGRIIPIFR